jgi:hypothetical protein
MPWLPGIDHDTWAGLSERRIEFLERYARLRLTEDRAEPGLRTRTAQIEAADALTRAAELALATDRSDVARRFVDTALGLLLSTPNVSDWSTHRVAVLGGVTGRVSTRLGFGYFDQDSQGVAGNSGRILLRDEQQETRILGTKIKAPAAALERTLGALISSALVSGEPRETLELLIAPAPSDLTPDGRKAFAIAISTMEADTLPLFGLERRPDGGFGETQVSGSPNGAIAALIALEQRFAARLRLLAMDRAHWAAARARAPLIDWSLLVLHIALQRRSLTLPVEQINGIIGSSDAAGELHRFLAGIAQQVRPEGQHAPVR